jgi:hypothetical protein
MIQDSSELLSYLPSVSNEPLTMKTTSVDDRTINGYKLRQPTFEEMSDVWRSVGMSLLRWALAAFERDRADSMKEDDEGGRAGSSRGQESPIVSGSNSNSLNGVGVSTVDGSVTASVSDSPQNEVDGQDGIAVLPDTAFVITTPTALPFPEVCIRRNIDTEAATFHQGNGTKAMATTATTMKTMGTMDTNSMDLQTCEPAKTRKKALYAEQRVGPEGSKLVALAW